LKGKVQQAEIDKQWRTMIPEIERRIAEHVRDIAALQLQGKQAWANVTVAVWNYVEDRPDGSERDGWVPLLKLEDVVITDKKVEGPGKGEVEWRVGVHFETRPYTFSVQEGLTSDELELYRWYKQQFDWYDQTLSKGGLAPEDVARMNGDRAVLLRLFNEALDQSAKAREPTAQ